MTAVHAFKPRQTLRALTRAPHKICISIDPALLAIVKEAASREEVSARFLIRTLIRENIREYAAHGRLPPPGRMRSGEAGKMINYVLSLETASFTAIKAIASDTGGVWQRGGVSISSLVQAIVTEAMRKWLNKRARENPPELRDIMDDVSGKRVNGFYQGG